MNSTSGFSQYVGLTHKRLKELGKELGPSSKALAGFDLYSTQLMVNLLPDNDERLQDRMVDIALSLHGAFQAGKTSIAIEKLVSLISADIDLVQLKNDLRKSGLVYFSSNQNDLAESENVYFFAFDGVALWFYQPWLLNQRINSWVKQLLEQSSLGLDDTTIAILKPLVLALFGLEKPEKAPPQEVDWQALAAVHALTNKLTFIAGGPGTGKTTTVAKILSLINVRQQLLGKGVLNVALLAPTGKAAVRLLDSIQDQVESIDAKIASVIDRKITVEQTVQQFDSLALCLPSQGQTIHRFLMSLGQLPGHKKRMRPTSATHLLHAQENQAEVDLVLIDEASMIDLNLMAALCQCIPTDAQVILMGDPNQLPPVEPGSVFSEWVTQYKGAPLSESNLFAPTQLCDYPRNLVFKAYNDKYEGSKDQSFAPETTSNPLIQLQKTYRFAGDLKQAAGQINRGDFVSFTDEFHAKFKIPSNTVSATSNIGKAHLHAFVSKAVGWFSEFSYRDAVHCQVEGYQAYFDLVKARAPLEELEEVFGEFQVLCSTLEGGLGVKQINRLIEMKLTSDIYTSGKGGIEGALYHGKPILVTKNHPELNLSNGDVGYAIALPEQGIQFAFQKSAGDVTYISPKRLGNWQTAYAMTIHKSQGSEYQCVSLLLASYSKELLTRSLLYTGLTRAKERCHIWASKDAMELALHSP